jgi:hypothetical protein
VQQLLEPDGASVLALVIASPPIPPASDRSCGTAPATATRSRPATSRTSRATAASGTPTARASRASRSAGCSRCSTASTRTHERCLALHLMVDTCRRSPTSRPPGPPTRNGRRGLGHRAARGRQPGRRAARQVTRPPRSRVAAAGGPPRPRRAGPAGRRDQGRPRWVRRSAPAAQRLRARLRLPAGVAARRADMERCLSRGRVEVSRLGGTTTAVKGVELLGVVGTARAKVQPTTVLSG